MEYYFNLQCIRIKRWIKSQGINPYIGIGLALTAFVFASIILFNKTQFANIIYPLLYLFLVLKLSNKDRIDQLKSIFQDEKFRKIRLLENIILAIPFIVFLCVKQYFIEAGLLLLGSIGTSYIMLNKLVAYKVPTPFFYWPFEFIVGFRKTFWLFIIYGFVLFKALQIENINLSLFILIVACLTCVTYYLRPEAEFFVWVYDRSVNRFLREKILLGIFQSTILTLPFVIVLAFVIPEQIWIIGIIILVMCLLIVTVVLAKYSAFPHEMNLPQGILFTLAVLFPPLLMIVIPIFYSKAKLKLERIL